VDQLGNLNYFGVYNNMGGLPGAIWADAVQVEAGEAPTEFEK